MASIIKNQILKYLSRYFKNLSTDQINFNIKGEGGLKYLELDENALTDLLELPAWMRIKSATCNKVTFHIPWTKLKSEPMVWNLDEVFVEIKTCEELRSMSFQSDFLSQSGKYNTINRIVDGMTINVNTVFIKFTSSTFIASLQILRIKVESKSSSWKKCNLRHTKIKDTKRGQLLLFKELTWQLVRIEAQSITETDLPPLRLLTNEAVCRITIKKRLSDCFILGSKLVLILDDLLWVLTDSQLKAALHFLDSLSGLIKKANDIVRKKKAARKLEVLPEYQAQLTQQEMLDNKSSVSHIFSIHDVIETSYHFLAQSIDLHISDDPGPCSSSYPELKDGGSIQIKVSGLQVDYYPYHLAVKDRAHWGKYTVARYPHSQWLSQSQEEFRNSLLSLITQDQYTPSRTTENTFITPDGVSFQSKPANSNSLRKYLMKQFNKIMTSCVVLRIADFTINRVTTVTKTYLPKEFIKADKERYKLPESEILHAEFTYYYFPGDTQFPLPPPKFYIQIYPIEIQFDVVTILWFNTFFLNLHKSLMMTSAAQDRENISQLFYIDVKLEAIQPHVIFDTEQEKRGSKDRPCSLHFQVSRISVTNTRSVESHSSKSCLAEVINAFQKKSLFFGECFPSSSSDLLAISGKFISHIQGKDNIRESPQYLPMDNFNEAKKMLSQELLWVEAKDVWCAHLESIWGEFHGVRAVGNRPVPFLDAFPLTLWVYIDPYLPKESRSRLNIANVHVLANVSNMVSLQINPYQAVFLTKILKDISEVATFLTIDTDKLMGRDASSSTVVAAIIPQVELTLVTSAVDNNGKESFDGDDIPSSIVPDSSSLDTRSMQWNNVTHTAKDDVTSLSDSSMIKHHHHSKSFAGNISKLDASLYDDDEIAGVQNAIYERVKVPTIQPGRIESNTFSQFKKGIANFMSMDFAPKSPAIEDFSDTVSIRSDDSSDNENYLMPSGNEQLYHDDANAMFYIEKKLYQGKSDSTTAAYTADALNNVEIANEALSEEAFCDVATPTTTASEKDSFPSSYKRKDPVAASTLKMAQIECMVQSVGLHSVVKMQVGSFVLEECFSIPWDELQNKFTSRARDWTEVNYDCTKSERWIKLRYENEVCPPCNPLSSENTNVSYWRNSHANVIVDDLSLEIQAATIKSLSEFLDVEKLAQNDKPITLEVHVNNARIVIREELGETGSVGSNSTPVALMLRNLKVSRNESDIIVVEPVPSNVINDNADMNSVTTASAEFQLMRAELELLRKRLAAMEYLSEENHTLRQYQEETRILRSCLNAAQEEVSVLLEEKRSLLEYVSKLQNSHSVSENATCKR